GALVVALSTLGIEPWPGQLPYGAEQAREYHRQDAAYATLAGLQGDARIWFAANFVVRGFPPRLATVHGVRSFQDVEPLYLVRPDFDPLEASYVEGTAPLPDDPTAPHGHPVTIVIDQPHAVEIEADCSAPGLIVLTDTFAPGWEATVDGSPAPVLATNHLFR